MSTIQDGLTSFKFNGVSSSSLGIIKVTTGNRVNKTLSPTFQDRTTTVPGKDGVYYFGSNYAGRTILIEFAFDNLRREQIDEITRVFNGKELKPLILDDEPDVIYMAKLASPVTLKYLCFEEVREGEETPVEVYKGEGAVQFTTFDFGQSEEKTIGNIQFINKGEIDSDFTLTGTTVSAKQTFELKLDGASIAKLTTTMPSGTHFKLDTKSNLIINTDKNTLLNRYIDNGDFFQIPCQKNLLFTSSGIDTQSIKYRELYY